MKSRTFKLTLSLLLCLLMLVSLPAHAETELKGISINGNEFWPADTATRHYTYVLRGKFSTAATMAINIVVEGDGLSYQWYETFADDHNFVPDTDNTGSTYSDTLSPEDTFRKVYCVITDQYGNSLTTCNMLLIFEHALSYSWDVIIPQEFLTYDEAFDIWHAAYASGDQVIIEVNATGSEPITYEWYYREKNSTDFIKTSSFTGNTYSLAMTKARDGRSIFCRVIDANGNTSDTPVCTIQLRQPTLTITQQPESVSVGSGETATVTVKAEGDGLKYQWYYANKGSSTFSKASITSATYSVEMTKARAGRQIYCVITDAAGNKVTTDTVTLGMAVSALTITQQPQSVSVASGETATVTVKAEGSGLKYQWYYANKGSSTFSKASITSATYSVEMTKARAGRQIYCVITDAAGNKVTTDTVTLGMAVSALTITQQPQSVSVASGETATVTVKAEGSGLKYQWYYANKGSSTFSKASITSATYSVEMTKARAGRQIYCVITDAAGNKITTDTVTLGMAASALTITQQPQSITVGSGETATVTVKAEGDGLKYQWYYANKGSSTFSKASITSATYSVEMTKARAGRQIYCVITDAAGNKVTTDTVTLGMAASALTITQQPQSITVGSGETATVTVKAEGDGLKYQWYYANKGSSTFSKASITSATYSVEMTQARAGRQIYCVITDAAGNKVTTDTVTLGMAASALTITRQPVSVTVANGKTAKVSVEATGNGLTYAWYFRNEGDAEFTRTTAFKGTSYSVQMNADRSGRQVYCIITDQNGNMVVTDIVTLSLTQTEVPQGLEYRIDYNGVVITKYTGSATSLVIPSYIEGQPVTVIDSFAFLDCTTLTSIVLPDTVTAIYMSAFRNCANLTSINLPASLTYIASFAFCDCSSLISITIPQGITTICDQTFQGCVSLLNVTIPDSVTSIGEAAFYACLSLPSITLPDSVTSVSEMAFQFCSSLKSVKLPSGITTISAYTFLGCSSLSGVTIPSNVTSIGQQAFQDCSSLTSITIPDSVTELGQQIFIDCHSLTSVRLPKGITEIPLGLFQFCTALTSYDIPNTVTTIGSGAFGGCSSLKSVSIPASVTSIGDMAFSLCTQLSDITLPAGITTIGNTTFYATESLTSITIPDSVTSIGSSAFQYSGITKLVIPSSVTTIGSHAFYGCYDLESITVPASVTEIGESAFDACSSLKNITVLKDSYAHQWFMDNNYEYALIFEGEEAAGLQYDVIDGTATITGYVGRTQDLVIPDTIDGYPVTKIGAQAFGWCKNLTSIVIPASVTGIEQDAFSYCTNLTSVTILGGVRNIDMMAFYGCSNLTSVSLPNSLTAIGWCAFSCCDRLNSIVIPAGVTAIDPEAFPASIEEFTVPRDSYAHQWCIDNGYEDKLVFTD